MVQYIPEVIFRASFIFCMGDKPQTKGENGGGGGGKRDETFFSAL
jgi:hypothetical protein